MKLKLQMIFAALAACAGLNAYAAYPEKPVRVIVLYPPGGTVDVMMRANTQERFQA